MTQLRFHDDNGNPYPKWEQKTLGEVTTSHSSNLSLGKLIDDPVSNAVPVYSAGGLAGYTNSLKVLDKPYFTIIKDGAGVGRVTKCRPNTYFIGTLQGITSKENSDIDYLFQLFQYMELGKDFSGSTIPHIYYKDYSKKIIRLPSLPEQKKIAEFLSALDARIELQERKVELLGLQKRGFVQRIFSRELRFRDDNGNMYPEWEQKTLGELTTNKSKRAKEFILPVYSVSNTKGFIPQSEAFSEGKQVASTNTSNYKIVEPNDIVYNPARINVGSIAINLTEEAIVSPMYVVFNSKIESKFLMLWFSTDSFIGQLKKLLVGSVRQVLSYDDLASMNLSYPISQEQTQIITFFSLLDKKIKNEEDKLKILKKQKQGYMQRIFNG